MGRSMYFWQPLYIDTCTYIYIYNTYIHIISLRRHNYSQQAQIKTPKKLLSPDWEALGKPCAFPVPTLGKRRAHQYWHKPHELPHAPSRHPNYLCLLATPGYIPCRPNELPRADIPLPCIRYKQQPLRATWIRCTDTPGMKSLLPQLPRGRSTKEQLKTRSKTVQVFGPVLFL